MLFVWTTLFSALFVLADALELPWPVAPAASGFLVLIALAQWYFGEGRRARLASVVVGMVYCSWLVIPILVAVTRLTFSPSPAWSAMRIGGVILSVFLGGVLGYLAGTLVAGVFLVSYWIDWAYANWRRQGSEVD
jgi:hypothetical protein